MLVFCGQIDYTVKGYGILSLKKDYTLLISSFDLFSLSAFGSFE